MQIDSFELEEERLKKEIIDRRAKKVLAQLPEGLKPEGPRLAAIVEDCGAVAIVSADPCYGACDLPLLEAETLGVDLIIHYGHTEMMEPERSSVPIVYMEAKASADVGEAVMGAIGCLKPWREIGLATTIQHIHKISEAKEILENAGKTVYIGDAGRAANPGQVLGCDYSNAKVLSGKVEAFVFVGGGRFHALGLSLATMKPTVVADPFEKRAYSIEADAQKLIRKRWASISEANEAENFGVIIGLKPGQKDIGVALRVKRDLEKSGRRAVLLAVREITSSALSQFPTVDAYVNTACPRIALDDSSLFAKPVLTVKEAYVALGKARWEDILKEGIV